MVLSMQSWYNVYIIPAPQRSGVRIHAERSMCKAHDIIGHKKVERTWSMNKVEEMLSATKLNEILKKRDEDKIKKTILWILAIVGIVVAVAGIAYAVYRFLTPDYLEDFDEDFIDDFEDDFFEDEETEE